MGEIIHAMVDWQFLPRRRAVRDGLAANHT
jgi:hypothetical protein